MQVCTNCVTVNDFPRLLTDHPTKETHDIIADDEWGKKVVLPLGLTGVTSQLPIGLLTDKDWNQHDTLRVTLTNKHLTLDPNLTYYEDQDNAMTNFCGKISRKYPAARGLLMIIEQVTTSTCTDAAEFNSDESFNIMIFSNVTVKASEIPNSDTKYVNIKSQKAKQVDSGTLSKSCNIDLDKAKKTVT